MFINARVKILLQSNVCQCKELTFVSMQCFSIQGFGRIRFWIFNVWSKLSMVNKKGSNSGNRLIKWPHFSIYRLSSMNSCLINDSFITFSNKSHTKIVKYLVLIWSMCDIFKLSMSMFFQCSELLNPQVQWVQGHWKNPWLNSIYM